MFIKHGDNQVVTVVELDELTEEQKKKMNKKRSLSEELSELNLESQQKEYGDN